MKSRLCGLIGGRRILVSGFGISNLLEMGSCFTPHPESDGCKRYGTQGERKAKDSYCSSLFIRYNAPMAVTRRQKEVIDFLESFVSRNGYSPSFEEIARGMGLKSLATVHKHITNLEKKGLLDRVHNRSRSIDVLPPGSRSRTSDRLPLAGRIAAGLPVETFEVPESISLHDVVGNRDVFALEVRGDSMRDEHIISGDYVLVERTRTARQGEIVVALVHGNETTLKRFYSEGSVVRLQPANMEMDPIYVPAAQVAIQGRVLGVLRKYR
jgi:repressor LexA